MSPSTRSPALRGWRRIPGPPRDAVKARLLRLYVALRRRHGLQRRWPGGSAYEIALGAIVAQQASWSNAPRVIAALRAGGLLDPRRLVAVSERELGGAMRAAGTSRLTARCLRDFTAWLLRRFGGRFRGVRRAPLAPLRAEMLAIPGLGPEAVDAILLHAAHRPIAVADASTRRLLARHRLVAARAGYERTRAFLEAHLPSDPALLGELHALAQLTGFPAEPRYARRRPGRPAPSRARPSP
jgi:endonuclease-3 related protein